jgi:protein subunit release factor B
MLHFMTLYAIRDMNSLEFRNDGQHPRMVSRPENATLYLSRESAVCAHVRISPPFSHQVRAVFGLSSWRNQALP